MLCILLFRPWSSCLVFKVLQKKTCTRDGSRKRQLREELERSSGQTQLRQGEEVETPKPFQVQVADIAKLSAACLACCEAQVIERNDTMKRCIFQAFDDACDRHKSRFQFRPGASQQRKCFREQDSNPRTGTVVGFHTTDAHVKINIKSEFSKSLLHRRSFVIWRPFYSCSLLGKVYCQADFWELKYVEPCGTMWNLDRGLETKTKHVVP